MFSYCYGLSSLDLGQWDTSNVKDMESLFLACSNIRELDLSIFDTRKVTSIVYILSYCEKLKTLILGEKFKNVTKDAGLLNGEG